MYTIFTCLYFKLTAAILACHSLPHLTFPYMVYDVTALCMTTPLATPKPPEILYAILFYANTSGNAQRLQPTPKPTDILYAIYFHTHGWHTSTPYLFLTDGVTVPSPSPFPYTP